MRKEMISVLVVIALTTAPLRAGDIQVSTTTVSKQPAEFLENVSAATQIPGEELKPLDHPGLGTMEILVLTVLHKKAGVSLSQLLEQRKKGVRLSQLIRQENQDEREIYTEAWRLRKQIDGK